MRWTSATAIGSSTGSGAASTTRLSSCIATGCSTIKGGFGDSKSKALDPAELTDIASPIAVDRAWSLNLGDGREKLGLRQKGLRLRLQPADLASCRHVSRHPLRVGRVQGHQRAHAGQEHQQQGDQAAVSRHSGGALHRLFRSFCPTNPPPEGRADILTIGGRASATQVWFPGGGTCASSRFQMIKSHGWELPPTPFRAFP